ncbi:hypothetical protein DSL72_003386 [Monilinia vaccinii-corymbosi]|uniref:Uncharacterized protein n=1 Tax=Monilinia vaccinii-corymbosi TaxID=61207 RepID=A0A8A3P262_9HELO|nr:hypothetical protein DSL72_003386 [Monilinia vaccinii-corymbosi]
MAQGGVLGRNAPAVESVVERRGVATAADADAARAGGRGFEDLGIENTQIRTRAGVDLSEEQKVIVGSVLDLFAGRPSLPKLSLWTDTATFSDPITKAEGRKQFAAQWYGLQAVFSPIERLGYEVTSAGNPVVLGLKTRYVLKGLGKEQVIESQVRIWTEGGGAQGGDMKIVKVEDAWGGEVPSEGAFAKAFRNLNSVVVPAFVSVPKNDKEDAEKGNQ